MGTRLRGPDSEYSIEVISTAVVPAKAGTHYRGRPPGGMRLPPYPVFASAFGSRR